MPAEVIEIAPAHLSPGEITLFNARAKARAIALAQPRTLVLGVDTEVAFEGAVLGKPANMDAAFAMVKRLGSAWPDPSMSIPGSGCATPPVRAANVAFIDVTRVHFHQRSDAQLRAYLARIGPLDKAGAYAAQEDRGELIESIEGSFSNVIGLPMEALEEALKEFADPRINSTPSVFQRMEDLRLRPAQMRCASASPRDEHVG